MGDVELVENSLSRMTTKHRAVEEKVAARARKVEQLLVQQKRCNKLKVLFGLPATLQKCLDTRDYGTAVEAYSTCAPFLRQHCKVVSFKTVLEHAELQMGQLRSALERRLSSDEITLEEAIKSSLTLV